MAQTSTSQNTSKREDFVSLVGPPVQSERSLRASLLRQKLLNKKRRGGLPKGKIEAIWLLTGLGKSKQEIADIIGIKVETVHKYLSVRRRKLSPEEFTNQQIYRANIARAFATRLAARGMDILETIGPEEVKALPLVQRSVVAGIMIDKSKVMDDRAAKLDPEIVVEDEVFTKHSVAAILESVKRRLAHLTVLNVQLPKEVQDRLGALEVQAEVLTVKDVETGEALSDGSEVDSGTALRGAAGPDTPEGGGDVPGVRTTTHVDSVVGDLEALSAEVPQREDLRVRVIPAGITGSQLGRDSQLCQTKSAVGQTGDGESNGRSEDAI